MLWLLVRIASSSRNKSTPFINYDTFSYGEILHSNKLLLTANLREVCVYIESHSSYLMATVGHKLFVQFRDNIAWHP